MSVPERLAIVRHLVFVAALALLWLGVGNLGAGTGLAVFLAGVTTVASVGAWLLERAPRHFRYAADTVVVLGLLAVAAHVVNFSWAPWAGGRGWWAVSLAGATLLTVAGYWQQRAFRARRPDLFE